MCVKFDGLCSISFPICRYFLKLVLWWRLGWKIVTGFSEECTISVFSSGESKNIEIWNRDHKLLRNVSRYIPIATLQYLIKYNSSSMSSLEPQSTPFTCDCQMWTLICPSSHSATYMALGHVDFWEKNNNNLNTWKWHLSKQKCLLIGNVFRVIMINKTKNFYVLRSCYTWKPATFQPNTNLQSHSADSDWPSSFCGCWEDLFR
jgi:hypothetical protein